jgi:Flp pilus assembly protein TadG
MRLMDDKGASAVEFALILPLLVLLIFGVIEMSLLLYNQQILTNASREGARAGIVLAVPRVSAANIETVVNTYAAAHLVTFASTKPALVFNPPIVECISFGDDLTVTVSFDYNFFVLSALTANAIPISKTLTAQTIMKCE